MIRLIFLIAPMILLAACSQSDTYNRGYVISQSHLEPEVQDAEAPWTDAE